MVRAHFFLHLKEANYSFASGNFKNIQEAHQKAYEYAQQELTHECHCHIDGISEGVVSRHGDKTLYLV